MSQGEFETDWAKLKKDFGGKEQTILFWVFVVVVGVFGTASSFYTVQPDEEAVVVRLGKYLKTAQPGLNLKIPFGVDKKVIVKTKQVLQEEFGFRSKNYYSRRTVYSRDNYNDESLMLTGDLNVANVEWVVQYQISDPFKFLFQTSEPLRNIRDVSESIMRRVVGDRSVTEVLTTGRVEISNEATLLMQEVLDRYNMGVKVVTVKLQDVNPPDSVKPSFNEVNEAKQEQEKMINESEEKYNKIIPEARGTAEKVVAEAEGYANALINRTEGEIAKFKSVLKEYKKAPVITKKRIYIETMERLFKRFDDVTIIDPKVKGLLPVYQRNLTKVNRNE